MLTGTIRPTLVYVRQCRLSAQRSLAKIGQGMSSFSGQVDLDAAAIVAGEFSAKDMARSGAGDLARPRRVIFSQPSAALQLGIRILAVAKVAKTFGDSRDRPKLLTSSATLKLSCNAALVAMCAPRTIVPELRGQALQSASGRLECDGHDDGCGAVRAFH